MNPYENVPQELRQPAFWLQYYLSTDPRKPDKKPRKHPCVKYATPEDRAANLRSLDYLLENRPPQKGVQRYVDKSEGITYIDLDHVRDSATGEIQQWAAKLIEWLDTYTEISASGTGVHIVCRGTLPEDFHVDPNQVEIYAGNIPNKLIAITGDVHDLRFTIEDRQKQLDDLLRRAKAGEFNKTKPALQTPTPNTAAPLNWRNVFHTGGELDSAPGRIFIKGILEEGITSIGSLSGVGKTWIGLSIAHALLSGQPLFGKFPVLNRANVLYLVPEMGGRKFRERMVKMRIAMDGGFFCQTIRDGACDLKDPFLLQAVADMHPVVILDTAIRFQQGEENSSTDQAQGLGASIFNLINQGALSVICMHHRKKTAGEEDLTLENALRGSGDFGAMSDCVWAVEHARNRCKGKGGKWDSEYTEESKQLTRLYLSCVKPRDMEPVDPFIIQGRPYIDKQGDFAVLDFAPETEPVSAIKSGDEKVLEIVKSDSGVGIKEIMRRTGFGADRVYRVIKENHIEKVNGAWQCQQIGAELPF